MKCTDLVVLLCAVSLCFCLELETRKGRIQGKEEISRGGRVYFAFRGIPYALPPVGKLRLRNPLPHKGWERILDGSKEAPLCIQKAIYFPLIRNVTFGQEDCLYLNVFSPSIDARKLLPVMVYVHGGGFRMGMSGPKGAPAFFMDEDVVLVTLHYRLGALGFLSAEDDVIPGNYGLKDQAMAIRWLSENIHDYGGDPDSIVVFGESAGAVSAHLLITSPLTRGLLKGGISQSGVMNSLWAVSRPGHARKLAMKVANIVGCEGSPFLDCLQSVEAEALIASELDFLVWDSDPPVVFQPVLEKKSETAFITEEARFLKNTLPWMTGFSNGEGIFKVASIINQDDSVLEELINNIDQILTPSLYINPETPGFDQFLAIIKDKYFSDLTAKEMILNQIQNFISDFHITYPMIQALQDHAGPKYAYLMSHRAENSIADRMGPKKLNSSKVCHTDELLSLFDWSSFFPDSKEQPEDKKVSQLIVKMWVNFAKNQNPSLEEAQPLWEEYSNYNLLHIQTHEAKMETISFKEIEDFWSKAFTLLNLTEYGRIKEEL